MNAETINKKIYIGRGKAAQRLGYDYQVYRPLNAVNPVSNLITTIPCAFNATDNNYKTTAKVGIPFWYGDFDGNVTQAGDYLIKADDPKQVYFIASQASLVPILCIACNAMVRIAKPKNAITAGKVGAVGYAGLCANPAETSDVLGLDPSRNGGVMLGWACSILFGKGRLKIESALPSGSNEQMGWTVMLPASVPVTFGQGMQMTDDRGRHFLINGAELSDTGWRLAVIEVHI